MSPVKSKALKKDKKTQNNPEESVEETETEDAAETFPIKAKKGEVIALDEHVEIEVPDEKIEDVILPKVEEEEEFPGEEIALDDEELNPFGDKWEE